MNLITELPALPRRPADGHKGTFGKLLVVGGTETMIGAPMLAARAAYRAGCGLVQVAMPLAVLGPALTLCCEAIGVDRDDSDALAEAVASADAIVVGPGLGLSSKDSDALTMILAASAPAVLDADALNRLAAADEMPRLASRHVLTPHPGEMRRLNGWLDRDDVPTDETGRIDLAGHAARTFGCTVLLKGRRTVITDGERARVNPTGDVTLAKAGSGDVLSGLIGSLLAQGMRPFEAACCGSFFHGLAGEHVGLTRSTRSGLAGEVADALAHVMPA